MVTQRSDARGRLIVAVVASVIAACAVTRPTVNAQSTATFIPVTDATLQEPSPDDWLMWRRTLDGWGYSPLDQIDRDECR